ncbi:MAG: BTAD domain-containing putative transcriptional regulator, partial [Solirubrobacteraceae bacterium]
MAAAPNVALRLRLIGQMEVSMPGGQSVLPTGRKTRGLLAIVALSAPRPALRGRLAEMLWSRRPEEQARASLRQELHRLLEVLAPTGADVLQVTRDHVALHPGAVWIDVDQVLRATPDNPAALALLEGDLLEDLDGLDPNFDAWLATERERLRDRGRELAEQLLREKDDPDALIPAAQRLLQIDRAHEGAWRALMRAHAARGERGMAIQAYDRCRAVLADMLDAAPSQETQKLLGEIRGPSGSRLPSRPPVAAAVASAAGHPAILTESRSGAAHVGVLPFQLVSADDSVGHLAAGLTDEIAAALSQLRWLSVVASGSLARFAGQARDETEIRALFGLDYVLDGTVQLVRDRLRVSARLLDLRANGQVVWARRFDRQSPDLLSAQDEIASEVAAQIDSEILLIEGRHSAAKPLAEAGAYDLVLRAIPLMHRMEWEPFMQAGGCLRQAIEADPEYAPAYAWRAYWHVFLLGQGWEDDVGAAIPEAEHLAQQAIRLDPMNARAMTIAGHVRAVLGRELLDALPLHERA